MKRYLYILTVCVIVVYAIIVSYLAKDIPYFDDYKILLHDTFDFFTTNDLFCSLRILFSTHGEHRLLFTHAIGVLSVLLFGKVNLQFIVFFVFMLSLLLFFFLLKFCDKGNRSYLILPAALLLFSGSNLETFIWSMSGLANIGINVLVLLTFYLMLTKKGIQYIVFGVIVFIITVFSNGNGLTTIPILLIGLLWLKRKRDALIIAVISVLLLVIYFYDFSLSNTGSANLFDNLKTVHLLLASFLLFVGNNFFIPEFTIVALCTGIVCIIIYLFALWKKYYKSNLYCFAFLTYLYLSSMMVALGRGKDLYSIGADRYHVYGSLILICTVSIIIHYLNEYGKLKYYYTLLPFVCIFYICSMFYTGNKEYNITKWKEATAYNWQHYRCCILAFDNNETLDILSKLQESEMFIMPDLSETYLASPCRESILIDNIISEKDTGLQIEDCEKKADYFVIKGYLNLPFRTRVTSAYLWLISKDHQYKIETRFGQRFGITHEDSTPVMGFLCCFNNQNIVHGEYSLTMETHDFIKNTNKFILSECVFSVE